MGAISVLTSLARLSPSLRKAEEVAMEGRKLYAGVAPKNLQFHNIPPGKELPGLNRVETADMHNQLDIYRRNNGLEPGAKINIPLYQGKDKNWADVYTAMKRHNEKTWWGESTGDVGYDRTLIDQAYRDKKELGVDVLKMSPEDYLDIAKDFPSKNTVQDSYVISRYSTGSGMTNFAKDNPGFSKEIDDLAAKMVKDGLTNIPVLDYTTVTRDGLKRVLAAQRLGIREIPVAVIRSNAPVELKIDNIPLPGGTSAKKAPNYSASIMREGSDGRDKNFFGGISTDYNKEKDLVMISYSEIKPEHRGRGLGLDMYRELIGKVLRDKHRFGSDDTLSPESYRVWQSLEREGYKLRKAPGVREVTIGEEVGYRGPRNEPIFEVIGLPIKKEKPLSPPKVKPKSEEVRIAERMLAIHQNADRAYQRAQRIQAFQNAPLDRARALRDAQRGTPITSNWNSTGLLDSSDERYVSAHVSSGNSIQVHDPIPEFYTPLKTIKIDGKTVKIYQQGKRQIIALMEGQDYYGPRPVHDPQRPWLTTGWDEAKGKQFSIGTAKVETTGPNTGALEHLVVSPQFRRKGLASEILKLAEQKLGADASRAKDISPDGAAFLNDRATKQRLALDGDVAALVQKAEEAAPTKTDTIMAAVKKEATVVTDTVDIKKDQTRQFTEWLKTQKLPPGYDAEFLQQLSLENATDIPPERIFEVAKSTAYQYIDDIEMAREAGIADY